MFDLLKMQKLYDKSFLLKYILSRGNLSFVCIDNYNQLVNSLLK